MVSVALAHLNALNLQATPRRLTTRLQGWGSGGHFQILMLWCTYVVYKLSFSIDMLNSRADDLTLFL